MYSKTPNSSTKVLHEHMIGSWPWLVSHDYIYIYNIYICINIYIYIFAEHHVLIVYHYEYIFPFFYRRHLFLLWKHPLKKITWPTLFDDFTF